MKNTYNKVLLKNPLCHRSLIHINRWRRDASLRKQVVSGSRHSLEKLGSPYGGWFVPVTLIASDWIVYCAGVGEDITFDMELIRRFQCDVYAFDPTPRAIAHVSKVVSHCPQYHFVDIGLWSESTTLRLWAPRDSAHVSHSALNLQGTDRYFDVSVQPLAQIMRTHGHDHIDLLKLDIEGAEYEVIKSILASNIRVGVLCVEFDQPIPWALTADGIGQLLSAWFHLVKVDGWNFTFLHDSLL